MASIRRGVTQLTTKAYLEAASFTIPAAGSQPCDIEDWDVELEDEFADLAWRFEQGIASERLVRMRPPMGLPHRTPMVGLHE